VDSAGTIAAAVSDLGMPVYGKQTPDGYSMKAEAWNNTSDLVSRMNFALALSSNRVAGVHTDWAAALGSSVGLSAEEKDKLLEAHLLHAEVSERTRQTILGQITAPSDQQQAAVKQISAKNGGRDPLTNLRLRAKPADSGPIDPQTVLAAGLILGSPEFQRR
jgi:hypothetical protein